MLRISGGADQRVTDSDAFFRDRHPVLRPQAVVPEAERTARAAEEWTREVMRRLEGERFNVITLKWWGAPTQVPSFLERHGVGGTFVGESAFLRGLGAYVGLEPIEEPETDDPVADLRRRFAHVRERLDGGDTFVFVHQKTTDAAGHTKDPREKQRTIEQLDAALGELPLDRRDRLPHRRPRDAGVARRHPLRRPGAARRRRARRPRRRRDEFGELTCARGILGHLRGPDLMPVLLNAADRPLFLGSRPTPFDGADGYPALLEPLT